jgi:hypothetical protein
MVWMLYTMMVSLHELTPLMTKNERMNGGLSVCGRCMKAMQMYQMKEYKAAFNQWLFAAEAGKATPHQQSLPMILRSTELLYCTVLYWWYRTC